MFKDNFSSTAVVVPREREKRLEFELVDVPPDAEPLIEELPSRYITENSSRARDMHSDRQVPIGEAMAFGRDERSSEAQFHPTAAITEKEAARKIVDSTHDKTQRDNELNPSVTETDTMNIQTDFKESSFLSRYYKRVESPPIPRKQLPMRQNTTTRASESGDFSLNTYAWEWAPYLRDVKAKVQRNIYLPEAFRRLGLIGGETHVRFRIHRDGHVGNMEVLYHKGHESLRLSSINSIKTAQPFKPLPFDFPADVPWLEITAMFRFINDNNNK